jgi:hypothetical protein
MTCYLAGVDPARLRTLLESVRAGQTDLDEAMEQLARLPFRDLGFAKVDHHRALRTGFPEVVLGAGKSPTQLVAIFEELMSAGGNVLCTRVSAEQASAVRERWPAAVHEEVPRLLYLVSRGLVQTGLVVVATGGTVDLPVAEEAARTAELCGCVVDRLFDVGVAGLHRLLAHLDRLRRASVVVAVAGMEGALPSVVAGVCGRPVIAVPTSGGYGASFGGLAALLGMLSACAAGVTVVNIDNGFGAGYTAALINRGMAR